jgi:glycosyltransferase involved in cell wall biosynthesis
MAAGMSELTVCFYTGSDKPFKRGTNLRNVMEALSARGVRCTSDDTESEPDVYVFEKTWQETRFRKPTIVRAENILGQEDLRTHTFDRGDAIVFGSQWLRRLYFNTYGSEIERAYVIPPGHRAHARFDAARADPREEQHIVCAAKWWKRPFKRFPLIATAFDHLNRELGFPDAHLHVVGWLTDQPMPFLETRPRLWRVKRRVLENPNIHYHQKGFHDTTYDELLAKAHLVVHPSALDSGPQVVLEALSQGIPVVIGNNMGAAEWIREIGPRAGRVLELDAVSRSYEDNARLPLHSRRLCSDVSAYRELAEAMRQILTDYAAHSFDPPHEYTMDGIAEAWLEMIHDVVGAPLARGSA